MPLDEALSIGVYDKAVENAEQDETTSVCKLIFPYTLSKQQVKG